MCQQFPACGIATLPRLGTLLVLVVVTLAVLGCIEDEHLPQGVWDAQPDLRWRVVETLRIGDRDGDGPTTFGDVGSVFVDRLERIWVVDAPSREVRVFGEDGAFVRSIGGRGEGPGEFRGRIGYASRGQEEEVWVEDIGRRWEVFDTAGNSLRSVRVPIPRGNMRRTIGPDGTLILQIDSEFKFYEVDNGELSDTGRDLPFPVNPLRLPVPVVRFEGPNTTIETPPPFAPRSRSVIGGHALWSVAQIGSDQYQVQGMSLEDGRQLLDITHQYEPVPIPESIRASAATDFIERYTSGTTRLVSDFSWRNVPAFYPAIEEFVVATSGELWIRRVMPSGIVGFDVFDAEGRYLGQPNVPPELSSMRIDAITGRSIYAVDSDELGVDYVVKMTVIRPGLSLSR